MSSKSIYLSSNYEDYEFKSTRNWRVDGTYEPFVYIIQEVDTEMIYIGSKTARNCLESDLGTKYFSSSNVINWKDNPESFEICKIIPCCSNHDAIILERRLIFQNDAIWRNDFYNVSNAGLTCNMTGRNQSQETKEKISEGQLGRIGGFKNKIHNEETKNKMSNSKKGNNHPFYRKYGEDHPSYGTKRTEEQKLNISKSVKAYMTEDHKARISETVKNLKKVECEYCGKFASPGMYSRWHGNNCKKK